METAIAVEIKTLTPLWTGGIEAGKVDRVHETGILGSLRWWYEVLVRGLGGWACDPSVGRCRFDAQEYRESKASDEGQRLRHAGLCDVCQTFGATGWRRRFRLTVLDHTAPDPSVSSRIEVKRPCGDHRGKTRVSTWYFPEKNSDKPRSAKLTLLIQGLVPDFSPEVIAGLIQFIADWGAVGARAQMGFGVIALENSRLDTRPFYERLVPLASTRAYPKLPSLRNVFLARISPNDGSAFTEVDTFSLKCDLRQLFSDNRLLCHSIMGTVERDRIAAKVKMSRPYDGGRSMRVWGWIPQETSVYRIPWDRDSVANAIYDHLNTHYALQVWREMDSVRDTAMPTNTDAKLFLRSLLGLRGDGDAV